MKILKKIFLLILTLILNNFKNLSCANQKEKEIIYEFAEHDDKGQAILKNLYLFIDEEEIIDMSNEDNRTKYNYDEFQKKFPQFISETPIYFKVIFTDAQVKNIFQSTQIPHHGNLHTIRSSFNLAKFGDFWYGIEKNQFPEFLPVGLFIDNSKQFLKENSQNMLYLPIKLKTKKNPIQIGTIFKLLQKHSLSRFNNKNFEDFASSLYDKFVKQSIKSKDEISKKLNESCAQFLPIKEIIDIIAQYATDKCCW